MMLYSVPFDALVNISNATFFTYIVSYLYTVHVRIYMCVYTYNRYIDGNSTSGYLDKKVYIRLLRLEMMCPRLFLRGPLGPGIS